MLVEREQLIIAGKAHTIAYFIFFLSVIAFRLFHRSCGRIVCTFCAPAGDTIQGDGINTSYTTDDFRLALPWRGLYTPQRICVQCYYDSSYPGLSSAQI